jgi:hypothetical protein
MPVSDRAMASGTTGRRSTLLWKTRPILKPQPPRVAMTHLSPR